MTTNTDSKSDKTKPKKKRKKPTGRPKGRKHSKVAIRTMKTEKVIQMAAQKIPVADIARAAELPTTTTRRIIEKFSAWFKELENVNDYTQVKSDLFNAAELRMVKSMMEQDKLDKASVNNLAYAFTQLHSAGRLERNQSTANISKQVQFTKTDLAGFKPEE